MSRCSPGVLALALLVGCGSDDTKRRPFALDELRAPDRLTLYSIDPRSPDAGEERRRGYGVHTAVGEFRGYPVLGEVEITDPELRKQLIAGFKDGYARRPAGGSTCFNPRHAVRVAENGRTLEYLICFECEWFDEFEDTSCRRAAINDDVRSVFDKPLKEAHISIAPR
jgi:hypothetical protein